MSSLENVESWRSIGSAANHTMKTALLGLTWLAFALRVYQLASTTLSWDEGWSLGLSALPLGEINRITALDVHPPLYYDLLKLWLSLGLDEFAVRFLSVVAGTLAVPLAYRAGRAWSDYRAGWLTAAYVAVAPSLVYYSQVTRMFALSVSFLFLATWGLVSQVYRYTGTQVHRETGSKVPVYLDTCVPVYHWILFVVGAAGALYTFYYSALVLAAMFIWALIAAPRRTRSILVTFGAVGLVYLPWVVYAAGPILARVGSRTGGGSFELLATWPAIRAGLMALVFGYGVGWIAVYVAAAVIGIGLILGVRHAGRALLLPLLAVVFTLVGVAAGAQAHMFAARYVIVASPFLGLAVGWTLSAIWQRSRALFALAVLAMALTTWPTLDGYVYAKLSERLDPFDPSADWRTLQSLGARADDVVVFNVLSLAGTYARYQTTADPTWSYALRWDPVIEPLEAAVDRVRQSAATHRRVWVVLYKGTYAGNAALKTWLDAELYPAFGQWEQDTLYLGYVSPDARWQRVTPQAVFGDNLVLDSAAVSMPGDRGQEIAVDMTWHARALVERDYKVFVHAYARDGTLIAQHDAFPANDSRPTSGWVPGESITDHHGLFLPSNSPSPLRLVVGLYDRATGERLRLANGSDAVELPMANNQ